MTNKDKYLINCQAGENNLEHATIKFILAATASKTHETAVFITADATHLLVKGKTDGLVYEGLEPIADLMQQFLNNGGKIWVCPVCVTSKGLTADDFIEGVEIAGAPKTMDIWQLEACCYIKWLRGTAINAVPSTVATLLTHNKIRRIQ